MQVILSEEDEHKDIEMVTAICKLKRLEKIKINHDYAYDMKALDNF